MNKTKITFLILMIIQIGKIAESVNKREITSFINYSAISVEKETEFCIHICVECFSDDDDEDALINKNKVYFKILKCLEKLN